jgi:predicted small secreted protein
MNIIKFRKKSTVAIALSLILGLFLSGCATTLGFAKDTSSETPPSPHSSSVSSSTVAPASSAAIVSPNQNAGADSSGATLNPSSQNGGKEFYGNWKTAACIAKSASYALSEEEIQEQIGTIVSYEENLYKKGTAEITLAGYTETTEDSAQFQNNFGISLADIGITEDTAEAVAVGAEGDFFGGTFYIRDSNTLVIYYDGVFFEATRV